MLFRAAIVATALALVACGGRAAATAPANHGVATVSLRYHSRYGNGCIAAASTRGMRHGDLAACLTSPDPYDDHPAC